MNQLAVVNVLIALFYIAVLAAYFLAVRTL